MLLKMSKLLIVPIADVTYPLKQMKFIYITNFTLVLYNATKNLQCNFINFTQLYPHNDRETYASTGIVSQKLLSLVYTSWHTEPNYK